MGDVVNPLPPPVIPPGLDVTVYPVIAEPPLLAGAVKATETCPSPAVAAPMVGASGAVGIATVWVVPLVNAAGPTLPAASEIFVEPFRLTLIVPLPVMPLTVTVTLEPVLADTLAIVPFALPVNPSAKSSVEMLLTDSLKFTVKSTLVSVDTAPPTGAVLVTDGVTPSTTSALLAPSELAAPGDASVRVALFVAASRIVPPFNDNELVAT